MICSLVTASPAKKVVHLLSCNQQQYYSNLLSRATGMSCLLAKHQRSHTTAQAYLLSITVLQSRKQCAPVLVLLRDLDSQGVADSGVQQAAKLAKAIQGQHNDSSQQAAKQLSKYIHKSSVPIAVEDDCWAQNPSRVQSCSCELPTCM